MRDDEEQGSHGYDREIERILAEQGVIFFDQAITRETASEFARKLHFLELLNVDFGVCYLSSPGGDVNAALGMCDFIVNASIPLVGIGWGEISSGAVCVLAAFPQRFAFRNTRFMLHKVEASHMSGNADEVESFSKEISHLNNVIVAFLSERTGQSPKKIAGIMDGECYFGVAEAIELGLLHGIVERDGVHDAKAQQLYRHPQHVQTRKKHR